MKSQDIMLRKMGYSIFYLYNQIKYFGVLFQQQKRGSFLARSKEALARIAEMTKPVVNPSKGAKSGGKFTFNVISPEKERPAEEVSSD